ncbi:hypothetical protein CONCODRAFT_78535 [Conidiobolus coronatus NRRL 28638]|uniref:CLASP N-terminal domain-containing protein n=1 Tax=Conidiobolus coronatus (strain ATCC 28846 / CBS 209.66 / NRRL 28638) TaxID=796925 RepID=A0A137P7T4_CONC2|nr:hypothetical protein CONCODRAFT_78535 [Conidiobolus coronatus NRRL 28638]|eukprot:KXN71052.1 hypothetical protein CONCODRAFT_78535 [Conidiobolus coronatus NRRL 28638]
MDSNTNADADTSILSVESTDINSTTPPSLAPLSEEFKDIKRYLETLENDQEWEIIITKLARIQELAKLGLFNNAVRMKKLTQLTCINNFIITERTQLMSETLNFVQNIAQTLTLDQFNPLLALYLPNLIKNLGKTNKLFVKKTSITLQKLILNSINKGQKLAITEVLLASCKEFGIDEFDNWEICIKFSSEDSALEVRNVSKKLYDIYSKKVDETRKQNFISKLSDNSKKTLKLLSNTRPATSKLSIAELKRIKRAEQIDKIGDELEDLKVQEGANTPPTTVDAIKEEEK